MTEIVREKPTNSYQVGGHLIKVIKTNRSKTESIKFDCVLVHEGGERKIFHKVNSIWLE